MIRVPEFLLRRLYVKGSLANSPDGFSFELRNSLGSGYARKMTPLSVDDEQVPLQRCSFSIDEKEVPFSEVSPENPFTLAMNRSITVNVRGGSPLSEEAHRIGMGFDVMGLGTMRFHFTDVPSE